MKRLLCLLICGLLTAAAAAAEEQQPSTGAESQVYALSDVPRNDVETVIEESERPKFVTQLMAVAAAELGTAEGSAGYTKYGEWAGDPYAEWCAEFIVWCVNQTDERNGTQLLDVVYPNYSGQNTGRDWFIARGRFVYRKGNCPDWGYQWLRGADDIMKKNDYIPRSGDLLFFSYNEAGDTEHVALVEYCALNTAGQVVVHVIEGNNPSAVQRNSYMLDNSQILGFGACEDVVDTTMRSGNTGDKVLVLQQRLNRLGLLEDRHLTGTFGSNTRAAVSAYQSERMTGQTANGIADRATQQAIEADYNAVLDSDPDSWLVEE